MSDRMSSDAKFILGMHCTILFASLVFIITYPYITRTDKPYVLVSSTAVTATMATAQNETRPLKTETGTLWVTKYIVVLQYEDMECRVDDKVLYDTYMNDTENRKVQAFVWAFSDGSKQLVLRELPY